MIARRLASRSLLHFKTAKKVTGPHWLPTWSLQSYSSVSDQDVGIPPRVPQAPEPRYQTTIIARDFRSTTKSVILDGLKRKFRIIEPEERENAKTPQALVILGTPEYVEWLHDDGFIQDVLTAITNLPELQLSKNKPSHFEIDVLCAGVDGLTPAVDYLHSSNQAKSPIQGLSFLCGRSEDIMPGLWDHADSTVQSLEKLSTLTFSAKWKYPMEVTVPLSNTLFKTGKYSTLVASKWVATSDFFIKAKTLEKTQQVINVFDNMKYRKPQMFVPLVPLTPARRITEGLGNIVRKLEFDADDIGPASRELESAVHDHLGTKPIGPIWALVTPKKTADDTRPRPYSGPFPATQYMEHKTLNQMRKGYISARINSGDKLCQVVSGGGGWGSKMGLLSLDPQTNYYNEDDHNSPLEFADKGLTEKQISAFGKLAEPGATIQFFRSEYGTNPQHIVPWIQTSDPAILSIVIGTTPSAVDETTTEEAGNSSYPASYSPIKIGSGHFGCASQNGVYIHRREERKTSATKVGVPNSYFYSHMQSAACSPDGKDGGRKKSTFRGPRRIRRIYGV